MIGQMSAADVALQPYDATVRVDPLLARLANSCARTCAGASLRRPFDAQQLCRQRGAAVPLELQQQPEQRTWQDVERMIQFLEDAT